MNNNYYTNKDKLTSSTQMLEDNIPLAPDRKTKWTPNLMESCGLLVLS